MREYLQKELDLTIKSNWQIFPTDVRGIDFVGYRHFYNFKLLRKTTCKRFKQQMRRIKKKQDKHNLINYSEWCSANSYQGWLHWCNSYILENKYFTPIKSSLEEYYNKIVKGKKVSELW